MTCIRRSYILLPLVFLCGVLVPQAVANQKPLFETGSIVKSDGAQYAFHAIPCVTMAPGGNLIAVWTVNSAAPKSKLRIVGAMSRNSGRTWSAPFPLIDNSGKEDADPSLVID